MKRWLALFGLMAAMVVARSAQASCYVAFIHGYQTSNLSPGVASDSARRAYWQNSYNTSYSDFVNYASIAAGCSTLVVGYDGTQAFWDNGAAGAATDQIVNFVTANAIPDGQLIIVGHSMGGLLTRWILNNGVQGSAYYNYQGHNYARVVQATRYAITVATPHLGAKPADTIWGTTDTLCGNFVGDIAGLLGQRNAATQYMTRWNDEYASANGSWYQDSGRFRRIYTIATRRWDSSSGSYSNWEDTGLAAIWDCIGFVGHWYLFTSDTPGDGLVTEQSGMMQYERSGNNSTSDWGYRSWTSGAWVQGARSDFAHMDHNHNQVRYDAESLSINYQSWNGSSWSAAATTYWPGSFIRANGLNLPN
jgi:hypothetical protein